MQFIDTHIDTLWQMGESKREFYEASGLGHVDLHRARSAGLICGFFTGFPSDSFETTQFMLNKWIKMVNDQRNNMSKITSFKDFKHLEAKWNDSVVDRRKIGAVLHFEGAAGIDSSLERLYIYYEAGLRSMSLTWNEQNQFASGQEQGEESGVTEAGRDLLSAMEDLGVIIDISHLNDKSFWDVISHTNSPILASHSNVRGIANHRRNLTNDMIKAIHDSGGSIGVNLYKGFLNTDKEKATREDAIKMFGRLLELTDIKTVHSGSDLDGAQFPDGLSDVTEIPQLLLDVQKEYNLNHGELQAIAKGNVKRVMKAMWKS